MTPTNEIEDVQNFIQLYLKEHPVEEYTLQPYTLPGTQWHLICTYHGDPEVNDWRSFVVLLDLSGGPESYEWQFQNISRRIAQLRRVERQAQIAAEKMFKDRMVGKFAGLLDTL